MSTSDEGASRQAARIILDNVPTVDHDPDSRPIVELFYSLVTLLPPTDVGRDVLTKARRAAIGSPTPQGSASSRGVSQAPKPTSGRRLNRPTRSVGVRLPALIALLAALVFTTALLVIPRSRFEPSAALYLSGTGAAGSARGVALLGDEELLVFASGLSQLERGYRYTAWDMAGGTYHRLGTMTSIGNDRARLRVQAVALPDQLEVTIEPSTATGAPSGPTVLAGFGPGE